VFPRGLPVGTIESIAPDPLHQPYTAIVIKPAANLTRLEEVLVITGTSSTLPPSAAQDADAAEATAEANQRTADLIAEKLPSLHSDTEATTPANGVTPTGTPAAAGANGAAVSDDPESQVGALPGIPNSGLPRPKPVMHPDRFTPGVVPPATDLTPGAPATAPSPQTQSTPQQNQSAQQQNPQ
jgi:rod shape-determining protein MreC